MRIFGSLYISLTSLINCCIRWRQQAVSVGYSLLYLLGTTRCIRWIHLVVSIGYNWSKVLRNPLSEGVVIDAVVSGAGHPFEPIFEDARLYKDAPRRGDGFARVEA